MIYRYENNLPALLGFVLSFVSMLPDINGGVYCHVQMSGIDPDLHNQDIGWRLLLELDGTRSTLVVLCGSAKHLLCDDEVRKCNMG